LSSDIEGCQQRSFDVDEKSFCLWWFQMEDILEITIFPRPTRPVLPTNTKYSACGQITLKTLKLFQEYCGAS
jgi:hypothetical protein